MTTRSHCFSQTLARFTRGLFSNRMIILICFFLVALQTPVWAHLNLHGQPLFNGATSFTLEISTSTLTKPTVCFITNDGVSQCRRRRGIEEKPQIIQFNSDFDIAPSAVLMVVPTPAPRSLRQFFTSDRISSSFDDSFTDSMNILQQLKAKGRNNVITVGDCGMSTVNFSQFLSCLGMTVQETTTLTATFTKTSTLSTGYTTMTVAGCTPSGFPYIYCPSIDVSSTTLQPQNETIPLVIDPLEPVAIKELSIQSEPTESQNGQNQVESRIYKIKMT